MQHTEAGSDRSPPQMEGDPVPPATGTGRRKVGVAVAVVPQGGQLAASVRRTVWEWRSRRASRSARSNRAEVDLHASSVTGAGDSEPGRSTLTVMSDSEREPSLPDAVRRQALDEGAWLTRDGDLLDTPDKLDAWFRQRGEPEPR
jgi:hypothetical protein